jgi:hypothetical protein
MNANAIAIGTPSADRYIRAASKFAFGDVNCFARIPPVLAGERMKIFGLATVRETVGKAAFIFSAVPSISSTDKSVCATRVSP